MQLMYVQRAKTIQTLNEEKLVFCAQISDAQIGVRLDMGCKENIWKKMKIKHAYLFVQIVYTACRIPRRLLVGMGEPEATQLLPFGTRYTSQDPEKG